MAISSASARIARRIVPSITYACCRSPVRAGASLETSAARRVAARQRVGMAGLAAVQEESHIPFPGGLLYPACCWQESPVCEQKKDEILR